MQHPQKDPGTVLYQFCYRRHNLEFFSQILHKFAMFLETLSTELVPADELFIKGFTDLLCFACRYAVKDFSFGSKARST